MDLVRALRTVLRTLHLLAFGALYGGSIYTAGAAPVDTALALTAATGAALLLLDVVREPVTVVQVRGLASAVKIGLAATVASTEAHHVALLTLAAVIGTVVSHMPGRYRYYSVFHGRVVGSQDKG